MLLHRCILTVYIAALQQCQVESQNSWLEIESLLRFFLFLIVPHYDIVLVFAPKHNMRDEMLVSGQHCSTKYITISHSHEMLNIFHFCLVELIVS